MNFINQGLKEDGSSHYNRKFIFKIKDLFKNNKSKYIHLKIIVGLNNPELIKQIKEKQ